MQAQREDVRRAPILVVGGVLDELIVAGEVHALAEIVFVIGLQNVLAVIVEPAIADQLPQPPAAKYFTSLPESPLATAATPIASFGRSQFAPVSTRPPEIERWISVKSKVS